MSTINTSEWSAELDRMLADFSIRTPIIDDRGFTLSDIVDKHSCSRTRAQMILTTLIKQGKVKHTGFRSGYSGTKVYELVKGNGPV